MGGVHRAGTPGLQFRELSPGGSRDALEGVTAGQRVRGPEPGYGRLFHWTPLSFRLWTPRREAWVSRPRGWGKGIRWPGLPPGRGLQKNGLSRVVPLLPPVGDRGPPVAQATLVLPCSPAPPRLPPSQQSGEKQNPTFRPVNSASFTLEHRGGVAPGSSQEGEGGMGATAPRGHRPLWKSQLPLSNTLPMGRGGRIRGLGSGVSRGKLRGRSPDPGPAPQKAGGGPQGSRVVTEGPPCLWNSRSSLCGDEEECTSTHNPDPGRGGSPRNEQPTPDRASTCSCALGSPRGQGRGLGVGERAGSPPHTAETSGPALRNGSDGFPALLCFCFSRVTLPGK